jgi:mRNA-degrading endonuclease toxin of MazEF toxin-antitoxin module
MTPNAGEIYWELVDGVRARPVVIVSREELNRGEYVVAVPLTSAKFEVRSKLPSYVPLRAGQYSLSRDCVAQAEAISLYEKTEIDLASGAMDRLDDETMRDLIRAIGFVLSATCEPD